jgi:hypothetical protein
MVKVAPFSCFWTDGAGVLTGWNWLGIPAGDHVVIRRSGGIERAKTWRCLNSGAFFGPLGGWKHELVPCDFLR